jgi:hypothetical protein
MKLSKAFEKYRLVMGQRLGKDYEIMSAMISGEVSKELDAQLTAESELYLAIHKALKGLEMEIKELSPKAMKFIESLPPA